MVSNLKVRLIPALLLMVLGTVSTVNPVFASITINTTTRTANTCVNGASCPPFKFHVQWDLTNTEAITALQWLSPSTGVQSLTNTFGLGGCTSGDVEYFGNAWAPPDPQAGGRVFVGAGTTGTFSAVDNMAIISGPGSTGCSPQSAGIPVNSTYKFLDGVGVANKIKVTRQFFFGTTPFATPELSLRPYIPRLFPRNSFTQVWYVDTSSTLVTKVSANCEFGGDTPGFGTYCKVTNWSGSSFAIFSPSTGIGLVDVRSSSVSCLGSTCTPLAVNLWIDQDGGSFSTATSVLLLQPNGGFTGTLTEEENLCFFDSTIWNPSLLPSLPSGC